MLTSTETSLRGTKRQDITYVRAAPRRRPLQLSLLLNKGLVFRPASLDLTAFHPSMIQKTIEQKTLQMQWRMIVSSDDYRWTETAQPLSNLRPGSHSRQHGSRELFQKPTGVTLEFSSQIFLTTRDNSIVLRQTWWRNPILTDCSEKYYWKVLENRTKNQIDNHPIPLNYPRFINLLLLQACLWPDVELKLFKSSTAPT